MSRGIKLTTSTDDPRALEHATEGAPETEELEELTATAPVTPENPTFTDLGVRPETVVALGAVGITRAFAIQQDAIPIASRGVDVIGQAPTGTGKTLGFGFPILEQISRSDDGLPPALVVVPTRELGLQVARDIETAGKTRKIRVLPVYGGRAYEPQIDALRDGIEVVVGTPGRLLDLYNSKHLRLDGVQILVLDEADRMLDLGFLEDVEKILAALPEQRQTMLFSATMPDPIVALSRRFLQRPITIHARHPATETGPSPQTVQHVYRTHNMNRIEVLARILQADDRGLTMVFCRTKRSCDKVAAELDFRGFAAAAVHGDLGQGARERALRAFRAGKIDVLVATDVAARGLDVSGVTHVINYDCPEDAETYVHRIGRTGRAGETGVAVTFVDWEDLVRWRLINKSLVLGMADPPETYHTSDHLAADLGIPAETTGTLPSGQRQRAGLSAEVEEVDPTAALVKPARRRRRGKTDSDGTGGKAPAGAASEESRTPRRRRRTRASTEGSASVLEVAPPAPGAAPLFVDPATAAAAAAESSPPRQRRRRRRTSTGAEAPDDAG